MVDALVYAGAAQIYTVERTDMSYGSMMHAGEPRYSHGIADMIATIESPLNA